MKCSITWRGLREALRQAEVPFAVWFEDLQENSMTNPYPHNESVPSTFADGRLFLRGRMATILTEVYVFQPGFRAGEEEGILVGWFDVIAGSPVSELPTQWFYIYSLDCDLNRSEFVGIPDGFIHEV